MGRQVKIWETRHVESSGVPADARWWKENRENQVPNPKMLLVKYVPPGVKA